MEDNNQELSRRVTVTNELGLHARPAAMVAEIAGQAESNVWLIKDEQHADASSIIDILSLACLKGANLTLKVENPEDAGILDQLHQLFTSGFGE
jgi:phosphotransferase system HPr (HPr) family protein